MTNTRGFTLIELMIVIVIVGILFSSALPSYETSVLRGHRADAQGILMDISAREERFLAQNNTYTTDINTATERSNHDSKTAARIPSVFKSPPSVYFYEMNSDLSVIKPYKFTNHSSRAWEIVFWREV